MSLYLNELSPQNWRGLIGTMQQLLLTFGVLVSYVFGLEEVLGTENLWPILLGFILVPALAHIGLFFAVESPKHVFFKQNDILEAEKSKEFNKIT